jgi:hypothetical protein
MDALGIPQIKLGLYFELDFFLKYRVSSNRKLSYSVSSGYTTGRKKVRFYIQGNWDGLSAGSETLISESAGLISRNGGVSMSDDSSLSATAFGGLQPRLWLYLFGFARAGLFQRTGVDLTATASSSWPVFTPVQSGVQVGQCDVCHRSELNAALVVESLSWELSARFRIKIWFIINVDKRVAVGGTLPGQVRLDLLTICAQAQDPLCGGTCCFDGLFCKENQCSICGPGTFGCGSYCCDNSQFCISGKCSVCGPNSFECGSTCCTWPYNRCRFGKCIIEVF